MSMKVCLFGCAGALPLLTVFTAAHTPVLTCCGVSTVRVRDLAIDISSANADFLPRNVFSSG